MKINLTSTTKCLLLTIGLFFSLYAQAQVTIGAGSTPLEGALLDLKQWEEETGIRNSDKGLAIPRVLLTEIDNLKPMLTGTEPNYDLLKTSHKGLMVYNVSSTSPFVQGIYTWDGTKWNLVNTAADNGLSMNSNTVELGGTLKQNTTVDLGAFDLNFSNSTGKIGIGTTTPSTLIDIESPTSGAIKITDGTEGPGKILTSNSFGVATWEEKTATAKEGTGVNPSGFTLNFTGTSDFKYTRYWVSVPPGRSIVSAGFVLYDANKNGYVTFALSTSSSTYMGLSNEIIGSPTPIRSTPRYTGFSIIGGDVDNLGQTTWYINNTNTTAQTLYIYAAGGSGITQATVRGSAGFAELYVYCAY